ncbi:DoxX family membrane protein [Maribacter sp. ANRC-HE7]|uniref:DoxX family membrane protein n=1 Tax=Maribacter aquimaris TaxID=2737171 RepID=A0ABR7UZN7_9FLAO|nr:DoxX family membrane protein [Maribacter aquimaris]MBD0777110.1 DoxX family membrane protein [Maribacter aquimaris]
MVKIRNEKFLTNSMVLLRLFIGWHFLYEGIIKLYNPDWTSFGYLASAQGPFRSFFIWMTGDSIMGMADWGNKIALVFVGLTLLLGIFEKWGAIVAALLLALYYLAHPSFPWVAQVNVEGSYWFVNKNLIELVACLVVYQIPTSHYFGLQRLFHKKETLSHAN